MKNTIIIGAGIGGLCTAIRLLDKGYSVTILEKEKTIGGKVNIKENKGFKFDLTASVLMSPKSYTNIFEDIGKCYKDYFEMIKLKEIYKVNYYDKTSYVIHSDITKTIQNLNDIDEKCKGEYINLITKSMKKYLISKKYFLDEPMINKNELINRKSIKELIKLNPIMSSNKYISSIVKNEKIKNYLLFKSMYIGINPYENSNIYTLIPAISQTYGLWYIKGGLYEYIKALKEVIEELGGNIILDSEVSEILIENKKVIGVKSKGKIYKTDIVVCNADYPYALSNLIYEDIDEVNYNKKNISKKDYSCSVFMIYLGLNKKYKELNLNNIYISKKFREGIEDAFNGKLPIDPSMYLYYPSATDDSLCDNKEYSVLNIMVRVPNLLYDKIIWNEKIIKDFRNRIIKQVKNIKGLEDIENHIIYEDYLTPNDLQNKFNSYKGNAFGLSHKLNQTLYLRPHMKSDNIENLYFIGSSTHPGNGVSVIIDGSKVLSKLIVEKDEINYINRL